MARGWESKSVEAQIEMAEHHHRRAVLEETPDPGRIELLRRRENLMLSRTRVLRELSTAQNPRYKAQLSKALADLDAKLSTTTAD